MDERQFAYPTRIRAYIAEVRDDGTLGRGEALEHRYFVARSNDSPCEVYDYAAFVANYPRGVTTEAELNRMEAIIRNSGSADDGDATEQFISAGVHITIVEE